jgi:hypothetical protein
MDTDRNTHSHIKDMITLLYGIRCRFDVVVMSVQDLKDPVYVVMFKWEAHWRPVYYCGLTFLSPYVDI